MTRLALVLPESLANEVAVAASNSLETAGVVFVSVVGDDRDLHRLLVRRIHWVPHSAYRRRESYGLSISSDGYVPALGMAADSGATPIWLHTHPGSGASPVPSPHDEVVDSELEGLFRLRAGSAYYGSLIVSPSPSGLTFTGYVVSEGAVRSDITRLWAVGDRLRLIQRYGSTPTVAEAMFDRSVRAFGPAIQHALGTLRVGVVGCGGTGSAVAEMLTRLGVRDFVLADPDVLSGSNVSRVYGSTPSDIGRPKVDVLADHLLRISPDARVDVVHSMLTMEPAARRVTSCDVLFGCTDDNAGRLVLSRMATYFLMPVIDCGVLLTSDASGYLTGIDGRITTLVPGQACLVCRGRIDLARAAAELMTPDERVRRVDEGYAPALGRVEPAVVTYTTLVAATAVAELLERLIGYGPEPRPSEVLLRCHEREVSTNLASPGDRHYCHPDSGKLGIGSTEPFLEQTWPA